MFLSALGFNGLLLVVAAIQASRSAPPSQVALWLAVAFIPNAALLSCPPPACLSHRAERWALSFALLPGLCMVAAPSVLSDDLYRFAWDAKLWLRGYDAYARAPADPALSAMRDAIYDGVSYPSLATIYPPLAEAVFTIGYGIARSLWSIKLLALGAHLLAVWSLGRPEVRQLAGNRTAGWAGRIYGFALNPLALAETALSGHVDGYVGLCMLLAAAAFAGGRWTRGTVLLGVCSGLKLVGGVFVPWLVGRHPFRALGLFFVTLLMVWPLTTAGGPQSPSGLGQYAQRWRGNEGGFAMLRVLSAPLVHWAASADEVCGGDAGFGAGGSCFGALVLPSRFLEDRGLRVRFRGAERRTPSPHGVFPSGQVRGFVARLLFAAIVLGAAFVLGRRSPQPKDLGKNKSAVPNAPAGTFAAYVLEKILEMVCYTCGFFSRRTRDRTPPARPERPTCLSPSPKDLRTLLLVLLLFSPQVHPWYLLWLLPLDIALGRNVATVWCAAALATYAPLDGWVTMRVWIPVVWAQWLQYGLVCAMLALESMWGWVTLTPFRHRHNTECG